MDSSNKLKKIEIEIYEENEVDFWLAYSNLFENEIYRQNLLNSIPNYQTKHSVVIDNLTSLFIKGSRDGIKSFWKYFKRASRHSNSTFYKELIGSSIKDFSKKDIALDLIILFGGFQMLKTLSGEILINSNIILSILSNRIHFLLNFNVNNTKISNISNRIQAYSYSETCKKFFRNDISKREIFENLNNYFDFVKDVNSSNNLLRYRAALIENFYTKLKKQYNFKDHGISIIIGYILSQVDLLDNQNSYDERDKKITYRDYLKSSVNNFMGKFLSKNKLDLTYSGELPNNLHFELSNEQKTFLVKIERFNSKILCKI